MRLRRPLHVGTFLLFLACAALPAAAKDAPRSFTLSTTRTFAPGESVKIQLYSRNVPALEFRVYKVRDAEKFFAGLKDLHSFGVERQGPAERIDQRTWIERLHDFKARLWWRVRHFFRGQFTNQARDTFREGQGNLGKRSRVVGVVSEFAQIPLLNQSQLVARWKLETPPAIVSETQQLPIEGLAAGVYLIEATDGTYKAYTVAIVTGIAIVERARNGQSDLYVADRKTGAPVATADVALWTGGQLQSSGKTGADGMASLAMAGASLKTGQAPENVWILARHGADTALVTPWGWGFAGDTTSDLKAYIYTDRPVYRPGHTVHIKAVVRTEKHDLLDLPEQKTLNLKVTDADGKAVLNKDLPVSAHGTVTADLELESDAGLGYYNVTLNGADGTGSFYVEEYKKPEYQVTVKPAVQRVLQGTAVQATIEARYFFGEPVANAKVKYVVHTRPHSWWDEDDADENDLSDGEAGADADEDDTYGETEEQEHDGVLDAGGRLTVTVPVPVDGKHLDQDYRIEARATDAANREVAGHATVLATYGSFRVSVEPVSYVFKSGDPVRVKVTAQDYDGKPVQTPVHIAVNLEKWDQVTRQLTETPVTSRDANTGADGTALVELGVTGSGDFEVRATADTPERRTVEGKTWVWEWNGGGEWYNANTQAQIVADKKSYQVGDTAHLLLVTGLNESWAVVTTEGDSVQSRQLLHATAASFAFDVPITRAAQPNLIVTALMIHDNQLITAHKSLKVPPVERTLTLTATPSKPRYLPGEQGSFDVLAVDSKGKPVEADLSFGEVDEALYSVRPDESGDIVGFFYPKREEGMDPQTSFDFFFSGEAGLKSPLLAENAGMYHPRLAQVKPGSDLVVPKVRKAFPDTAYWNPDVHTGPDGHARVQFNFPDSLTTWRTTIRGMTDDGMAGSMVTRVLVRKNLIVRLSAPRFFREGDESTLRVIAHNYLETAKDVTFALDVTGLEVLDGHTQKVSIPAKGENWVDWRVRATATGNAVLTAKALTDEESDALEMTLPVEPFGAKLHALGSGVVYSGSGQDRWSYTFPGGADPRANPGAREMTITVSSSVAGTVFDALDYLTSYPWGCTEQTMSSFLPDVIVAQAVDKLHLKPPMDRATLNEMVRDGAERLYSFQHQDGGWGWWPDDKSLVFMTAYVVSGLGKAKAAGYKVDDDRLAKGRAWLQSELVVHPEMLPDLRAYVIYSLSTTGGATKDAFDVAWGTRGRLSDEGLALLGLALDAAGDNRVRMAASLVEKKADNTMVDAHWDGNRYDGLLEDWGDTSDETTALALKLLIRYGKDTGLLTRTARWLAGHRDGGYWESTKQTAMVIDGLTDYLALSGELGNSSDVEVLVNGTSVGKRHFGAGDAFAAPWRVKVPAALLASGQGQVVIQKGGNGITYWSAQSTWYSTDKQDFQQEQVTLNAARDYFVLRKNQPKPTDPITYDLVPLSGPVHVGDVLAVRLDVNGSTWKYLMTEDPIPAGTEFVPEIDLYTVNNRPGWWANWATRQEFHDDRAAFFNTEFLGLREYFYLLKAVNPGKYAISPAETGPMYQPNSLATTDPATLEVQP